jgi:hypothetical protein
MSRGRPPLQKRPPRVRISTLVKAPVAASLDRLANEHDESRAATVRRLLMAAVNADPRANSDEAA